MFSWLGASGSCIPVFWVVMTLDELGMEVARRALNYCSDLL